MLLFELSLNYPDLLTTKRRNAVLWDVTTWFWKGSPRFRPGYMSHWSLSFWPCLNREPLQHSSFWEP
uniref:Macaca fascicularis brain cDNA, clone: QflA-19174 n=1 Tax=Macaca fascicularis TaxID=9541 RepID=I7GID8_MACFA|nr:unnamed protein product [Macaca fascicularis]